MQTLLSYFPTLSALQIQQFKALHSLYTHWNAKINVISRKDMDAFYTHHVLHSLAIAKYISFQQAEVLDIGTGGGFPAIPLAILFPDSSFHAVDSIQKKIKVVEEVVNALELKNVTYQATRVENIKQPFDFIVSRAVAQIELLESWTPNNFKTQHKHSIKNGYILLKGGNLDVELSQSKHLYQVHELSQWFAEPHFAEKKLIHLYRN